MNGPRSIGVLAVAACLVSALAVGAAVPGAAASTDAAAGTDDVASQTSPESENDSDGDGNYTVQMNESIDAGAEAGSNGSAGGEASASGNASAEGTVSTDEPTSDAEDGNGNDTEADDTDADGTDGDGSDSDDSDAGEERSDNRSQYDEGFREFAEAHGGELPEDEEELRELYERYREEASSRRQAARAAREMGLSIHTHTNDSAGIVIEVREAVNGTVSLVLEGAEGNYTAAGTYEIESHGRVEAPYPERPLTLRIALVHERVTVERLTTFERLERGCKEMPLLVSEAGESGPLVPNETAMRYSIRTDNGTVSGNYSRDISLDSMHGCLLSAGIGNPKEFDDPERNPVASDRSGELPDPEELQPPSPEALNRTSGLDREFTAADGFDPGTDGEPPAGGNATMQGEPETSGNATAGAESSFDGEVTMSGNGTADAETSLDGNATVDGETDGNATAGIETDGNVTMETDDVTLDGNATSDGETSLNGNSTIDGNATIDGNGTADAETSTNATGSADG